MTDCDVFAVAGGKGGVGKTTTSINVGAAAAAATGRSVVVVDVDLAMANLVDFLTLDMDPEVDPTLHDVLADQATVDEVIYRAPGDVDVIPSGTNLQGFAATNPRQLGDVVATLRSEYGLVILDTGAGVSYETILPLGLADAVILVSTPRVASVRDVKKTKSLTERVGGTVAGIVFVRTGTGGAPPSERVADFLSVDLLGEVPEDETVVKAQDAGKPVITYDITSAAAEAYWGIAEKLPRVARGLGSEEDTDGSILGQLGQGG